MTTLPVACLLSLADVLSPIGAATVHLFLCRTPGDFRCAMAGPCNPLRPGSRRLIGSPAARIAEAGVP